jgi:TM2 domain-containing membrane protein YozV
MKNKVVAALLAFFLGGFGAHKFYLGQIGWGVVYLLFCWTLIPGLAAFVEFFLLLATSEEAFNRRFNPGVGPALVLPANPMEQALALEKLAELQAKGLLSESEFEAKRRQILDRL